MVRAVSAATTSCPKGLGRRVPGAAATPPPEPAVDEPAWARAVDASTVPAPWPAREPPAREPPRGRRRRAPVQPMRQRATPRRADGVERRAPAAARGLDRRGPPRRAALEASAAAAPAPSAVDIADAFLDGDAVGDWDALRRDLARPAPPEPRPADDFGVPLSDDELYDDDDDYGDGDVRPYDVLRNRDDDRERATAWLGDYGPLHARTLRPSGDAADDFADDDGPAGCPGRDDDDDEPRARRRPDDYELEGE
ncbi:hypothetical protein JL720_2765 [Aureococcus anophagefferens]|nr:hypothetical protein JL720_2765 [Aureococcus anophagefferens]